MFGFFKKKEKVETWSVCVDDVHYNIDSRVARRFDSLEYENRRLKNDVEELRKKSTRFKHILNKKDMLLQSAENVAIVSML